MDALVNAIMCIGLFWEVLNPDPTAAASRSAYFEGSDV
jgi:hypothetical protein